MQVGELISAIRRRDLVLPEFQREYVWTREQVKQLFVSLLRGYPVGGLLVWSTENPPDLKNLTKPPEKLGTVQVLLDGQQRLTSLFMLVTGDVPPFYTSDDITNDPRDLYFNLETADLQYYQSSRMRGNPVWCRLVDCFNDRNEKDKTINVFVIAKQLTPSDLPAFEQAQRFTDNLTALRNIKGIDLPIQTVPSHATLDEAIDIFDRVNSQGTKLTEAELALTHVTGKWSTARRELKAKIDELAGRHFYFDLTFMTRSLTGVVTKRALFEAIHNRKRDELEQGWKTLSRILDYLSNILPQHAFLHSTEDMSTTNALVPFLVYLSVNNGAFPNERSLKSAIHWLYAALAWARYTAQTDQRLEFDVSLVMKETSPWANLCEQIIDQRGRIEVKSSDFEGRGAQHPLYLGTYILSKAHGATDWFNGTPLGVTHGAAYRIHSHHIFPQALLYKNGFDPDNHLDRKIVNEIANRAFLTAESNQSLSDRPPADYLPEIDTRYPGALVKQFIPMDPKLWRLDQFRSFLSERRELIARKFNEFMASLIGEPEATLARPITELIKLGEGTTLEFKSTLQWDIVQKQINVHLRMMVLKTLAAFMNTEGGTLVIGVEDDGNVLGLANDLATLGGSQDKFAQLLASMLAENIGAEYARLIKTRFETVDGKSVCVLDVHRAPEPVFVTGPKGREFYARVSNTTRALDVAETLRYKEMNWT